MYPEPVLLRAGRYETLRPIASGGMATVYLGRALGGGGFERLVAIKVLHPHVATEPEFVAMFLDEARLAAQIRHPNVVGTIDLVQDPLFLVMDYIEGPSLHLLLRTCRRQRQPFPIGIALRIFLDVLAGLHAAHELTGHRGEPLNLVHRDVSPHNVLVGSDGISRITDFGVARAESRISATRGGALKGKLGYMSPEQVKSQPVDRRSDLYAAGAVFWEMLTGERLFQADNDAAMIAHILAGARQGPRSVAAGVPEPLDFTCMRALANDPGDRYPTAAAFAEALEHAVTACPGLSIASSRAVATLVKGLNLHVLPQEGEMPASSARPALLAGSRAAYAAHAGTPDAQPPYSSPSPLYAGGGMMDGPPSEASPGSGVSASSAVSVASIPKRRSLGSLADVLEPESATTGVGGVVAEPPTRSLVGRPTLIAVGVATVLAVAAGVVIVTSEHERPSGEIPDIASVAPASPGPPSQAAAPSASASAAEPSASASAAEPSASASAAAPNASASAHPQAPGASPPTTRTPPWQQSPPVSTYPRTPPRPTLGGAAPRPSSTTYRPKDL